jgi:hypothetical protein
VEVPHLLVPAAGVDVARAAGLRAELAAQAGLLLDLAERAVLPRLAVGQLALRQRPVVVAGSVDDQDAGVAPVDAAGCAEDVEGRDVEGRQV